MGDGAVSTWNRLRSTYWFVPSVLSAGCILLGLTFVAIDRHAAADSPWLRWTYGGGADGARALLSAVAGSSMTVVSVTLSVTVVALTVSSQHFGPRLLNNFMRDMAAQLVLGTFIGTFSYCLVVLRTVQGQGDSHGPFVPHLSVTVAMVLTLLSVAALIYYVHHVSSSMRVSEIALMVVRDLERAVDRLYPEDFRQGNEDVPLIAEPANPPEEASAIPSSRSGYVQGVELDALTALAERADCTLWIRARPGCFVAPGRTLALVFPASAATDHWAQGVREAFQIGPERTSHQDAEFAIQQLVEVALHALSPGINEPFTAVTCIDRLGQGLSRLARRGIPDAVRRDNTGHVRLVAAPQTFEALLSAAFEPIVRHAGGDPVVYGRLLETLTAVAEDVRRSADLAAIASHAAWVRSEFSEQLAESPERRRIDQQYRVSHARAPRTQGSGIGLTVV